MRVLRLDPADDEAVRGCYDVLEAAMRVDDPAEPPSSLRYFGSEFLGHWDGSPTEIWYAPGDDGASASGWYKVVFPDLHNRHWAYIDVFVHPDRRRAGVGTGLLRHAAERATANGRTLFGSGLQESSAGEIWARHLGATIGDPDMRRVQDLRKIPDGTVARLRETAQQAASGYSLVRWTGVTPDNLLGQMAAVQNAMNDAPHPPGIEPHRWDAQQIRERHNPRIAKSPRRRHSVAAMQDATGEMAALTVIAVDPDVPEWGHQALTTVTRPHRGHRLGLLVKAAMLDWLAETEPQVERIVTWNGASNQHMIGINESLAYEVAGRPYRSVELPVASVPQS